MSSILASEKIALFTSVKDVRQITVEVYNYAKVQVGSGAPLESGFVRDRRPQQA